MLSGMVIPGLEESSRRKPLFTAILRSFCKKRSDVVAQQRLAMQKIKDVLRLCLAGGVTSCRQLGRAVGCGKSAVSDCLRRAKVAGLLDWSQVVDLDETELARRLYPSAGGASTRALAPRPLPDWTKVREELARRDHQITLALLWEEYKAENPGGYQYSQFAELYRRFEKRLSSLGSRS